MSSNINGLMRRASALALGLLFVLPAAGLAQDGTWRNERRREERRERRQERREERRGRDWGEYGNWGAVLQKFIFQRRESQATLTQAAI